MSVDLSVVEPAIIEVPVQAPVVEIDPTDPTMQGPVDDPSMPAPVAIVPPVVVTEVAPVVVAPAPVVVAPVVPAELPEQRYEYQPTDENGNRLGGMQVIKFRTQEELVQKLTAQSTELVRKLRQVTKEARLGKIEVAPDDADRLLSGTRKPLTTEERYEIAQDLTDPQKFEGARDRLLESAGFNEMKLTVQQLEARANAQVFFERHPEFYQVEENLNLITDWMIKNGLQPTVRSFERAQVAMNEAGLLLSSPIVREEVPEVVVAPVTPAAPVAAPVIAAPAPIVEQVAPKTQVPAVEPARISVEPPPQTKSPARVPSGLNSRISSDAGVELPTTGTWTVAQVEAMSSDEYVKMLRNPAFAKFVDDYESKRPARPRRS